MILSWQCAAAWCVTFTSSLGAEWAGAQDTLHLADLQRSAQARDPRAAQPQLLRSASALRLTSLEMERRPQLSINGYASHQSDVTSLPLQLAGPARTAPPKDRWQASVDVQQLLYDGGSLAARQSAERARLAESAAGVDAALYRTRAEVNAAFFAAYLLQERAKEVEALAGDLMARLDVARARVANGAALGRDTSTILAEQLRAELSRREALASRAAYLAVLAGFTGRRIDTSAVLELPDLARDVERVRAEGHASVLRARPEFAQFRLTRSRIDREASQSAIENRPRVVAFGQAGLGRPGLNQLRTDADQLWQAGLRFEWRPWTWRNAERSSEIWRVQQRVIDTEERALAEALSRAVEVDVADFTRLREALIMDERVVALRSDVERQARAQYAEGVLTAADYVEARTDVLEARLTLHRHRAELSQAQARFLTTLGLVPSSGQT